MGSHHSKTGTLGWEGAVTVDGVHSKQGRTAGTKRGGPRAGCRGELVWWGTQLWLPLTLCLSISYSIACSL